MNKLIFLFLLFACRNSNTKDFYALSMNSFDNQQYDSCLYYLDNINDAKFNRDKINRLKAFCFLGLDQTDSALYYLNIYLKNNSSDTACLIRRAVIYANNRQFKNALIDINSITEKYKDRFDARIFESKLYSELGATEKSLEKLLSIINDDPKNVIALSDLGLIYENLTNYNEAIKYYDMAIELQGYNDEVYFNRAVSYYKSKEYSKAIDDFNFAIKLNPSKGFYYYNLGYAYYYTNNLDLACKNWQLAKKYGNIEAEDILKLYCQDNA